MPIYEYRCTACGNVLEVLAKMSDAPPEACPKCEHPSPEKLISKSAFHLKGGGWYAQGYGAGGAAPAAGGEGKSTGKTDSPQASPSTSSTGDGAASTTASSPSTPTTPSSTPPTSTTPPSNSGT